MHPTGDRRLGVRPLPAREHSFVEIDHEIYTVVFSLPLIQAGHLSVSGDRMCTIHVNRFDDYACAIKVWLGN